MNDVGRYLGENAIALIGLLGTLALLGVTAWYAVITKRMSQTAGEAAADSARATAAAERAAEAALDAARVAQSQIRVEFTGRLTSTFVNGGALTAVLKFESEGDPVVVREIRVRRAMRRPDDAHPKPPLEMVGAVLVPWSDEFSLPRRLHSGEPLLMTHHGLQNVRDPAFSRILLAIDYAFSEESRAVGTRLIAVDCPE